MQGELNLYSKHMSKQKIRYDKSGRTKVLKHIDLFKDQLDEVDLVAKELKTTPTDVIRRILDNALELPKPTENDKGTESGE